MRWPENDEILGQVAVAFQHSALRAGPPASVPVSRDSPPLGWKTMNVIPDELPQEALRFVVEFLSNAREAVMSPASHLQGITACRLPIDQALHFIASGCG